MALAYRAQVLAHMYRALFCRTPLALCCCHRYHRASTPSAHILLGSYLRRRSTGVAAVSAMERITWDAATLTWFLCLWAHRLGCSGQEIVSLEHAASTLRYGHIAGERRWVHKTLRINEKLRRSCRIASRTLGASTKLSTLRARCAGDTSALLLDKTAWQRYEKRAA